MTKIFFEQKVLEDKSNGVTGKTLQQKNKTTNSPRGFG